MSCRCVIVFALCVSSIARAEPAPLDRARQAIEQVRYDEARQLLVAALDGGGNTRAQVIDIYRLSAQTAAVLGDAALAEQFYRRWLALEPDAKLAADSSPKLLEPFAAAKAYMSAHGRLFVTLARVDNNVEVTIASDPLQMVAAVKADDGSAQPIAPGGRVTLEATSFVHVLDDHGNRLLDVAVPPRVLVREPERRHVSIARAWWTWALASTAVAGTGAYFGFRARRRDADARDLLASGGFVDDFDRLVERRDRDALVANVLFATAGACAITTAIMFATQPGATAVTATVGSTTAMTLAMPF